VLCKMLSAGNSVWSCCNTVRVQCDQCSKYQRSFTKMMDCYHWHIHEHVSNACILVNFYFFMVNTMPHSHCGIVLTPWSCTCHVPWCCTDAMVIYYGDILAPWSVTVVTY
jgi:hypothetical protein